MEAPQKCPAFPLCTQVPFNPFKLPFGFSLRSMLPHAMAKHARMRGRKTRTRGCSHLPGGRLLVHLGTQRRHWPATLQHGSAQGWQACPHSLGRSPGRSSMATPPHVLRACLQHLSNKSTCCSPRKWRQQPFVHARAFKLAHGNHSARMPHTHTPRLRQAGYPTSKTKSGNKAREHGGLFFACSVRRVLSPTSTLRRIKSWFVHKNEC